MYLAASWLPSIDCY
ncbi:unnamed protein product [Acanthoscelides obtectus]|uniref:Uncharacterized protein n=1 Tax=Acanthoscelides obtectus TaxID=200917 RepID=A0A9P0L8Y6_ACAOB|nr:unnamed protein product [Acanthoscelides obtectus]CAK1666319.1 hypothetical protein AOBTE_LOCUS25254 [Acanthoscelides obtectus]